MEPPVPGFPSPFDQLVGLRLDEATGKRVTGVLPVRPVLHQPTGIVHGGVYATVAETAASIGALQWLAGDGYPVGMTNHTEFLRAVRDGELRIVAAPLNQGRSTQLWRVEITDDRDRLVAHSQVRLMNLRQSAPQPRPDPAGRAG